MRATIPAPALADAVITLRAAGCVFAEDEAAVLAGAASDETELGAMVQRRCRGEPLEQVVGYADFCGLRVRLRPGVFVPRVRSELLVRLGAEAARRARNSVSDPDSGPDRDSRGEEDTSDHRGTGARDKPGDTVVVDLCCGSGALGQAVAARAPHVTLYAADVDPDAVACARDNLGPDRVYQGDLFTALPTELAGRIDVLLANVPYVASRHIPLLPAEAREHEPHRALDGGEDGLDVFRAVVAEAGRWLAPGGLMLSEITRAQVPAATAAVEAAGLHAGIVHDDDLDATVVMAGRSTMPPLDPLR